MLKEKPKQEESLEPSPEVEQPQAQLQEGGKDN